MMTLEDLNLVMLMEECAEVAHRASKQLRFGADEIQPGQPLTNRQRLRDELMDLLTVVDFLTDGGQLAPVNSFEVRLGLKETAKLGWLARAGLHVSLVRGVPQTTAPREGK
jgi:hypothetical protein